MNFRPPAATDGSRDANRHAHGGMHRHGDGHHLGGIEVRIAQHLDGEINGADVMARRTQERSCRCDVEWLMAELIAGDQQDPHDQPRDESLVLRSVG